VCNYEKKIKKNIYFLTFLLTLNLFSQNFKTSLNKLKTENQNCLDTGDFMYNCSVNFYSKSDSLLNVVYNSIRKNINQNEKNNLRIQQIQWLKQRDIKFKQITNQDTGLGNGLDDLMAKNQFRSKIVNERTSFLISRFIEKENIQIYKSNILSFIPENYSILDTIKGNLNQDEFNDYILILKKKGEANTSNYIHNKPEKRPLLILTSNSNGKFELRARNENSVLCYDCSGAIYGDSYENVVIKNGYFSIEHYTVGGIDKWSIIITFKYDKLKKSWFLLRDGTEYFSLNSSNKPNAEAVIKTGENILTKKDFGEVNFEDFNIYE